MPIIQEAFDIPINIATGIATGRFRRVGGVVRVARGAQKGQIVKLLKPVSADASGAAASVAKVVKTNKKALMIAGAVVLVVAGGVAVYSVVKSKEPKEMGIVRERFDAYLAAVRNGTVDFLVVDQLHKALLDLEEVSKHKEIKFQLTTEELTTIIQQIAQYTEKLIELNNVTCSSEEHEALKSESADVFDLTKYLEIQKKIIIDSS